MNTTTLELSVTTQGPTYPPSEVMDAEGNFIVIGRINRSGPDGTVLSAWGGAIVGADSPVPEFGANLPYQIKRELATELTPEDAALVLHTLPLPLPCNNYPMLFAPQQCPDAATMHKPSYPFHEVPIPDLREADGRKLLQPVTLGQWVAARGRLRVALTPDERAARFDFSFTGLIPHSLYTVMSLRQHDLDPAHMSRPGPLGVPNVFVTDGEGRAEYSATLPDPFPGPDVVDGNRIINVVVLWMSYQMSHGGAIGYFGLGGDIHAQLKLPAPAFQELTTRR